MKDKVEILQSVSAFSGLPEELQFKLATELKQIKYEDGELIFHKGDPGDALFIIDHGRIRVFLPISGKRLTLQEYGPGRAIGELALIDGNPRSASALALGETVIWRLDREVFREALLAYPELILAMLFDLLGKLRFATSFIEKIAYWSQAVAKADYDGVIEFIAETKVNIVDAERIDGFLEAFSAMITEVKAREEAYQQEVNQLRIIIDDKKRDHQVTTIESSISFQELIEKARALKARRLEDSD